MLLHLDSPPVVKSTDRIWFRKTHKWRSQLSCQYQSKNQTLRSKELAPELIDRILSRQRSGEDSKNSSAALEVPKSRVTSITLSGTSRTIPSAGCLSRRSDGKRRDQEAKVLSDWAPERLSADGMFQKEAGELHQGGDNMAPVPPGTWNLWKICVHHRNSGLFSSGNVLAQLENSCGPSCFYVSFLKNVGQS